MIMNNSCLKGSSWWQHHIELDTVKSGKYNSLNVASTVFTNKAAADWLETEEVEVNRATINWMNYSIIKRWVVLNDTLATIEFPTCHWPQF